MSARARTAPAAVSTHVTVRLAVIGCLLGVAVTHLLDIGHKLDDAPYVAALFVAVIVASNVLALVFAGARRIPSVAWPAAGAVALGPLAGYVWSRAIGLPQIEDHVGHWADPFGTASLVFELTLLVLCLASLRAAAMRVAPSAIFMAVGLVTAGLMLGQAGDSHVGHAGHDDGHANGGGAGKSHTAAHPHAAAGGSHRHAGMNVYTATPEQRAEARELLRSTRATAAARFADFDAARAAGWGFTVKSFDEQKDLDYWHLTNQATLADGVNLDPERPESLMYWHRPKGEPLLVAVVYRVPTPEPNPALGGPILQWHLHKNAEGGFGKNKMTHLWLVPGMVDAYSMEMPVTALRKRFGTPIEGTGTGL